MHVVCPYVCLCVCVSRWYLVDHDHIGWKSLKLIARTISPTSSLFIAQWSSTYSQGNMEKFWAENVRSTPTSITSGWIESTESHVILGGGVAVYLLLSAHRAVIFVIAQLSCWLNYTVSMIAQKMIWLLWIRRLDYIRRVNAVNGGDIVMLDSVRPSVRSSL